MLTGTVFSKGGGELHRICSLHIHCSSQLLCPLTGGVKLSRSLSLNHPSEIYWSLGTYSVSTKGAKKWNGRSFVRMFFPTNSCFFELVGGTHSCFEFPAWVISQGMCVKQSWLLNLGWSNAIQTARSISFFTEPPSQYINLGSFQHTLMHQLSTLLKFDFQHTLVKLITSFDNPGAWMSALISIAIWGSVL